jgi:hypothetical protein
MAVICIGLVLCDRTISRCRTGARVISGTISTGYIKIFFELYDVSILQQGFCYLLELLKYLFQVMFRVHAGPFVTMASVCVTRCLVTQVSACLKSLLEATSHLILNFLLSENKRNVCVLKSYGNFFFFFFC